MRKMTTDRVPAANTSQLATALVLGAAAFAIPLTAFGQSARPATAPARAAVEQRVAAPTRGAAVQAVNPPAVPQAPTTPSPAASRDTDNRDVIARVGGDDLTANDIRAYVASLDDRQQQALARDPALLSQTVRLLLANRLVLAEALAKKWEQQPDIAAQLQRIRDSAIVELYLQAATAPPPDYPSEADIQKVYDANAKAFLVPRQFALVQIFVAAPRAADAAAEAAAQKRLSAVAAKLAAPGADFAAIAKTDNDAPNGGDLGWVAEAQIRPEILSQVIGLPNGAASKPIKLDDGWHIVKLIDTKASYTRTLPEVRDQLVAQMRAERATMARRSYLAQLLQQHPPMLNEFALSNLFGKSPQ